eukprot:5352061-Pleurochrysis_carterae.AAC.3
MTEPTMHSEVETGSASSVADVSATTVPICAAKARDGVMSVILEPTVTITCGTPRTAEGRCADEPFKSNSATGLPQRCHPTSLRSVNHTSLRDVTPREELPF